MLSSYIKIYGTFLALLINCDCTSVSPHPLCWSVNPSLFVFGYEMLCSRRIFIIIEQLLAIVELFLLIIYIHLQVTSEETKASLDAGTDW